MNRILAVVPVLLSSALLVSSCGGSSAGVEGSGLLPPGTYSASSGVAQKGPLIKGSTVTAQELDARLSPTGKQYSYQIASDLGTFAPTSTFSSQYIGLNATGYYYDEVQGAVSSGPVTLNGYTDLSAVSVLNVNLLTTLAYQRIQHLVIGSNMTFAAAKAQAENEILAALYIPAGTTGSFASLDLAGGTDGDHVLAAISSLFVYGNTAGPLSQLIANFQSDLGANGTITNAATRAALTSAGKGLNPASVAANLTKAYAAAGVTFTAANIADWIDQDGDGVIGRFKFLVPDGTPSSTFTLPAFVIDRVAGSAVSVTVGQLSVNGSPVNGPVTVRAGDSLSVSPAMGAFQNGVLTVYIMSGSTRAARISFVSTLLSIAITPSAPSLPKGLTQQFKATGTFSDTSTADVTDYVTWTSSTPTVATVDPASGLANALSLGATVVTATSGSVASGTTLTVSPAIIESIVITPNPAFSGVGVAARQLQATGTYSDGTITNVTNAATWRSAEQSVATIGPTTGLATGVSLGSTTISATMGAVTATTPLTIVANVWFPTGSLATARQQNTATLLQTGKVLVIGGLPTDPALWSGNFLSAELFDPVAGAWSAAGVGTAPPGHTATLLPDGKVLVAGGGPVRCGNGCSTSFSSAELYDPMAGTWSPTGSMATARGGATAILLPTGKVLVAGGGFAADGTTTAELYDPMSGTWSPTGNLPCSYCYLSTILLHSGKVLAVSADGTAYLYDPVNGTWSSTGGLSGPRGGYSATLLQSGKVLVVAGNDTISTGNLKTSAELYDPVTGTWLPTGSLSTARDGPSANLLPSGKVLVAGGQIVNSGTYYPIASAELYDPIAGTWSPASNMSIPRARHAAVLLQDGTVMVVGGETTSAFGGTSSSAELYW